MPRSKKHRPNYGLTPDELERAVRKIEKKARRAKAIPWDGTAAGLRAPVGEPSEEDWAEIHREIKADRAARRPPPGS